MSAVFAERPTFFEGQYLGADDLQAFLKYAREYDARHLLGAHTWGIVTGIELLEGTSPTGEVEYFLTPGVAVDGYGRLLVVTMPYKLTTDLFAQQPSGTVNVWIRFEETPFSGTRAGFQSCECSDAFARVAESVVVEVGPRVTVDQRESGVVVDEQTFVDAREALGDPLPNQPLACDGSVAAQTFPDAEARSLWLIPVGQVPWNKVSSSLLANTEADKKASLIFRRVAGLVTGHIYPASGVIRLRPRWSTRQAGVSTDQICALSAIKETDLVTCNGQLNFREMIWLEGNSRFTGDARLYGSRLEFREPQGTDYLKSGVPLALRRRPDRNEHNGFDLQVLLGTPQGTDGPTRLTIGKATVQGTDPCALDFQFEPGVYIQQDAKLGIGTLNTLLSLPLTIRAIGDTGNLMGFEAADGTLAWQMNFGANKNGLNFTETDPTETRLFLHNGGNVGIGTQAPDAKLDIRNVPAPTGNALGANRWLQVGDGDDTGRMWVQYGDQLAPLLVLSDFDDPPRIQFQQTGTGQETGPQFSSWIGHARNSSPDLALMGGNVGVGTLQPFRRLHVEASEIHTGGAGAGFSFGNREDGAIETPANGERWVWYSTGHVARLWSGGDKLFVTASGNLGIATATPAERLDVRGNIKLGANGDFFGVGCLDNLRMVAGRISSGGVQQSGSGFSVSRIAEGRYGITYGNAFSSVPVVVANLVDSLNQDNFLTVVSSTISGFELHSKDDDHTAEAAYQDSAFNFIALGPRA
ncbi:hypothetical protein [Nitrospira sp. BLG_1]|uniref:hypothetical protein n=1 Tax=Nitrospira sp. BLG_1 TaxID=3395883 RepID=UPI0039BD6F90